MDEVTDELMEFFEWMWEDTKGFVYLPVELKGRWRKRMFSWPKAKRGVVNAVLESEALGANIFFAPAVFKRADPHKDSVLGSHVLWVDFDGNAPENAPETVPQPQLKVQSSLPGHEHWYWKLEQMVTDVTLIDTYNRSLAYQMGADTSGWDADQLLRPIHTTNRKRNLPVEIKEWTDELRYA
jgi:hypothetical protein